MYKYKGLTTAAKFNELDNVLNPVDKIRGSETRLDDAKNDQAKVKSNLVEVEKVNKKTYIKREKTHCIILKCFTKQGMVLLRLKKKNSKKV